ncbi:MAG: MMPL family transporter [Gaiellaceae bacterium]
MTPDPSTRRQRIAAGLSTARARFRALDRRDRISLILWIVLIAVIAPFRLGATERMHASEVLIPGSEAAKAEQLSNRSFGREFDHVLLLKGPPNALDRQGPKIAERLAQVPRVRVLDPWRAGGPALRLKPDKAELLIAFRESFDDAGPSATRMRELLHHEVKPPLSAYLSGYADLNRSIKDETVKAMERSEVVAAPLLAIVLILILGSPIAAVMPLFLGGCVALGLAGVLDLMNRFVTPLEVPSIAVGTAMSLALGVDYSLLLVARFRSELSTGATVREASEIAAARAGRTVKFAAAVLTVAMAAATIATPASVLKSATAGVLVAVGLSLLGATVAMPPLLRWAGRDINRYQIVSPGAESRRWGGVALAVLRRPKVAALVVLGVMLALAAPTVGMETGSPDPRILPENDPARADFDVIQRELGGTKALPYLVTLVANHGTLADKRLDTLAKFERRLARDPQTEEVLGPATVARRTAALATVPGRLRQASAAVRQGQSGAARLEQGLAQATGGADQLVRGVSAAAAGSVKLRSGGAAAERGARQIHAGVAAARDGAAALRGGLARASAGARALQQGGKRAKAGAATIASKLRLAARQTRTAAPGAAKLASGLEQGARDLRRLKEPADKATSNTEDALKGLNAMLPTSKADPSYARVYKGVATAVGALSGKNPITGHAIQDGYPGMSAALDQAASQASEAASGASRLRDGVDRLAAGLTRLASGGVSLTHGLEQLEAGAGRLAGGADRLLSGARRLENGLGTLSGGTKRLLSGMGQLRAGNARLATNLGAGATKAAPLVSGIDALHKGAARFKTRTDSLGHGLGAASRVAPVFHSGYTRLAAIQTAPPSQRAAAGWAINWDRGGNAVHYLVAPRASYRPGASARHLPSRAGSPQRAWLDHRVQALARQTGATAAVGGGAATLADFDQVAQDSVPQLVLVLAVVTYLALVPFLRSLILPLIAVLLNVLTLLAAFGVVALTFQPGSPLGGPGYVDDLMVMVIYTVTFALSIDYAVFILDRMREGYGLTRSVKGAITYGIEGTGGVITGAAVIIAAVFLTFMISPVASLRQLGVGLTVAVLLDATLIRLVLLPAALRLVGERAWRTPRWLESLLPAPRTRAERQPDARSAMDAVPEYLN